MHQKELAGIFAEAGLLETRYLNLCGGVVAIVDGRNRPPVNLIFSFNLLNHLEE